MKVLDLFSGIGGFSLGLERAGMETVAFCEIEPFCQKILKKHWPDVPIYDDVRSLDYDGSADLICGGFPCQPFSSAGEQKGKEDDRDLWPSMFSIIKKHRPRWVIGENVVGIIGMELDNVLSDLGCAGYSTTSFIIPACSLDGKQRRDRVWILAHSNGTRMPTGVSGQVNRQEGNSGKPNNCGDKRYGRERASVWASEPRVGRVVDGLSDRVDRITALGHAVVPQITEKIGRTIMELENA